MRRNLVLIALAFTGVCSLLLGYQPAGGGGNPGQGLVIELDRGFIDKYADRATITSKFTISGISAVHPAKNDAEVHVGGWSHEAGLAGVSEVMNAANLGKKATAVLRKALNAQQGGEHAGTGPEIQAAMGPNPDFDPEVKSNPEHVFEIHPVTVVTVGKTKTSAADAIGETPGFTPHDANKAFVLGYETLPCKVTEKGKRVRIVTRALGFNFTEFVIKLNEDVKPLNDNDGHAALCTVFDTDGELLIRNRRMVFLPGTDADDHVQGKKKGAQLQVIGIPRISLKLIQWRLDNQNAKDKDGNDFDVSPLEGHLPYEMIIVAAKPASRELE